MREPICVRHSRGEYPVEFLSFQSAARSLPRNAFVITDENVSRVWGQGFDNGWRVLTLSPGERSKSIGEFDRALQWLAESGATRGSVVALVGGGVIGDLGGFVASTYMRGIAYVQVPTTLMAQVDSSVGGKVGIDLPQGKNLVGAFHPPQRVLVATETISTLPEREFRNGTAEIIKYGFILDPGIVERLSQSPLISGSGDLEDIVARCIELKKGVVEADEHETQAVRSILNFGHSVGHAIERVQEYSGMLHGEAISVGMAVEARIGELLGITERGTAKKVAALLSYAGLPTACEELSRVDELLSAMQLDKKVRDGELAMSLLARVGECKLVTGVRADVVSAALLSP